MPASKKRPAAKAKKTDEAQRGLAMQTIEKEQLQREASIGTRRDGKPRTAQQVVLFEKYAIAGLVEMLPVWYEEVGLGGTLSSLNELLLQCDAQASVVEKEGGNELRVREAAAGQIRYVATLSRPEVLEAIQFLDREHAVMDATAVSAVPA